MEGINDYRLCPSCNLRCLVFSGVKYDGFDVLFEKGLFSFDSVHCPLCGWSFKNNRMAVE